MAKFSLPYNSDIGTNNSKVLFINARIIDPKTNLDIQGELLVIADKIADFGKKLIWMSLKDLILI